MTVEKLSTAQGVVQEAGDVQAVYRYKHKVTGRTLWAVFMPFQPIDIYQAPYAEDVTMVHDGFEWLEGRS